MKNKLITLFLFILITSFAIDAQSIVFEKFELKWFSVMGFKGGNGSQTLKITFKNLTDNPMKYVTVYYHALNSVGDPATDNFNRNDFSAKSTGPFYKNKKNKLEIQIALFHPNLLKAKPYKIEIEYMNEAIEDEEIDIDDDNILLYFPKYKK